MNKIWKRSLAVILTAILVLGGLIIPVSADAVPDKDGAIEMGVGGSEAYISSGVSKTFKIMPDLACQYVIKTRADDFMNPPQKIKINVYDKNLNLIDSGTDNLSLWLEKKTYYFTVERTDGKDMKKINVMVVADISITVTTDGKKTESTGWNLMATDYICYEYLIQKDKELKVDLAFRELPKDVKYSYEWKYICYADGSDWVTLDSTKSSVSLKASYGALRCTITDQSSGKYGVYLDLMVDPNLNFKNSDGEIIREIKAWSTLEGRKTVFPEVTIGDGLYDQICYVLLVEDYYGDISVEAGNPEMKIPDDLNEVVYYHIALDDIGEKMLQKIMYYFVINDSTVKSIESDTAVHIDRKAYDEDIAQEVFSFTPQKTGRYRFYSSNVKKGNPVVAVFDDSLSCIAFNSDVKSDYNIEDISFRDFNKYLDESDINCSVILSLEANKTYYFAVPIDPRMGDLECDVKIVEDKYPFEPKTSGKFDDFTERLYEVALGRPSEAEGKAYWDKLVGGGTLTGADCARSFLTSPEFKSKGYNNEEFLKVLYKTFFNRDASDDPDGFNFWLNGIDTIGRDGVVEGFINSPEWCNICATYGVKSGATTAKATVASTNAIAFATRLYTECLGRQPEEEGLKFWSLGLTNLELTGSAAAHEFFFCKEFNDHNFDNKELITRMYRTFMGREPDDAGMTFWLDSMSKGMTKQQLFDSFVKSPEFTQICKDYAIERG